MCNGCHDMSIKANSMHNLARGYNNNNAIRLILLLCLKRMH